MVNGKWHTTKGTYFLKKYLANRPYKKITFYKGLTIKFAFFTDFLKNGKINFFSKFIIDLKIELLAVNINMMNYFRNLGFFFGPVNNKRFHSNLPV